MSNIRLEKLSDQSCIVLEGRVDIRDAAEFHKMLCDVVALESPVVIDCAAAEWLDTACLQLILAAHRAAPGRVTVRLTGETNIQHWLEQSGFAAELALA
jgi:anti-anti-sigma regulatory factor